MKHPIPTLAFRSIQRVVGHPNKRLRLMVGRDLGDDGNSGADCHDLVAAGIMQDREAEHALPNAFRYLRCSSLVGTRQEHSKFFAAIACRYVARSSQDFQNTPTYFLQAAVAFEMAVAVIEHLEQIDINHYQA